MRTTLKPYVLLTLTVIGAGIVFLMPPVPQPAAFHAFADGRTIAGVPCFWNVISNVPFLVIAVMGSVALVRSRLAPPMWLIFFAFFLSVALTAAGSAYYHLHPNNDTLVWDRAPLTMIFMTLTALVIAVCIGPRSGAGALLPLLLTGIASVVWWSYTEANGEGDLRLYYIVQFFPMLFIPLTAVLYYRPAHRPLLVCFGWIVVWYIVAKLLERWDGVIYSMMPVSGHTLKHLAAAVSTGYVLKLMKVFDRQHQ